MSYSQNQYKRTVHCSVCGDRGHNKSSCPALASKIERLRAENGSDHWQVAQYDAKKTKRAASAKSRKCSYCDTLNHNRATCPDLRTNILVSQNKNVTYRRAMLERMKALGVGVGTVLSTDRFRQRTDLNDGDSPLYRVPQVITKINWDFINFFNRDFAYFDGNSPWLSKSLLNLTQSWNSEPGWIWDSGVLTLIMDEEYVTSWMDGSHYRYDKRMSYFCDVESPVKTPDAPAKWLLGGDFKFWKRVYGKRKHYHGPL